VKIVLLTLEKVRFTLEVGFILEVGKIAWRLYSVIVSPERLIGDVAAP